jgi:hypothetical protein
VPADLDLHWSHMRKNAYIWSKGLNIICILKDFKNASPIFLGIFLKVVSMKKITLLGYILTNNLSLPRKFRATGSHGIPHGMHVHKMQIM